MKSLALPSLHPPFRYLYTWMRSQSQTSPKNVSYRLTALLSYVGKHMKLFCHEFPMSSFHFYLSLTHEILPTDFISYLSGLLNTCSHNPTIKACQRCPCAGGSYVESGKKNTTPLMGAKRRSPATRYLLNWRYSLPS